MKKKLIVTILAVIATVACVWCIAGCDNSGLDEGSTKGVLYELSDDKTYAICHGYSGIRDLKTTPEEIVISSMYKGKPVTEIYLSAFKERDIKSVVIPDSVTNIRSYAFDECSLLESVTMSKNIKMIGYRSFGGCTALKCIDLPEGLEKIDGSFSGCGLESVTVPSTITEMNRVDVGDYPLFNYCRQLKSITFAKGLTKIPKNALRFCPRLTEVNIPDSVTTIGAGAFQECRALATLVLPENVTEIESKAFIDCTALSEIYNLSSLELTIGSTNNGHIAYYTKTINTSTEIPSKIHRIDDFLFYREDKTTSYLLSYIGNEKDISLPATDYQADFIASYDINDYAFYFSDVTSVVIPRSAYGKIGRYAFGLCPNLEKVSIGENIFTIEDYAFFDCKKLKTIEFTDESLLITIGIGAFSGCSDLTEIFYYRDTDRWSHVQKKDSWAYKCNFTVHCTDGDVQVKD